jgi:hypothetical protein
MELIEFGVLPNFKVLPSLFFPGEEQLPADDPMNAARYRGLVFDFPVIAARDVLEQTLQLDADCLVWAITQIGDAAAGYRVHMLHDIAAAGAQRTLFNKPQLGSNLASSAPNPVFLKDCYLIGAGDSLLCEVRNMASVPARIQIVLHAAELTQSGAPALQTGALRQGRRRD